MSKQKRRVVFNRQRFQLENIKASVPQGSIQEHFFYWIYVKDFHDSLFVQVRLFSDDLSLVSVTCDKNVYLNEVSFLKW